jgi:hypothetical protein
MIRRLRRRHLRMIIALAVTVAAILVAALQARRPMPRQAIPAELARP